MKQVSNRDVSRKLAGEKVLRLRQGLGLSQRELATRIGVTPKSISNYETGVSVPDSYTCLQLASTAPSEELSSYFVQLAGAPSAEPLDDPEAVSIWEPGKIREMETKAYHPGKVWTRAELETDLYEKYFWVKRMKFEETPEGRKKAAKSAGIPLATLYRWMKLFRRGQPEALIPYKKRIRMYQAVRASTPEEAELVAKLIAILRSSKTKSSDIQRILRERYESIQEHED